MRSVGVRGVTALTIITLIFAPAVVGHHKTERLIKRRVAHKLVECKVGEPCPKTETVTNRVYLTEPAQSTKRK